MNKVISGLGTGQLPPLLPSSAGSAPPPTPVTLEQILYPQYIDNQAEASVLVSDLTMANAALNKRVTARPSRRISSIRFGSQGHPASELSASFARLLTSIVQNLISDLNAADVSDLDTTTVQGPSSTAQVQAGDTASNQQVSGSFTTGRNSAAWPVFGRELHPKPQRQSRRPGVGGNVRRAGRGDRFDRGRCGRVTFTGQIPTQQLSEAVLSFHGDNGQWQTMAEYTGSGWVQIGPSGDTAIQEVDSPVGGTNISKISLAIEFDDNSGPAVSDLGGTVFALTVPTPISLSPIAGGTVETPITRRSLPAEELATRPWSSPT